jgi:hypothetical protein
MKKLTNEQLLEDFHKNIQPYEHALSIFLIEKYGNLKWSPNLERKAEKEFRQKFPEMAKLVKPIEVTENES